MTNNSELVSFRARARLLLLLGEQLIRDSGLAVFELVKNSYDADARHCTVTMHDIAVPDLARIVVKDDGVGMTPEMIRNVWLDIGTDFRAKQRAEGTRSKEFNRLPLGEKGVGRLAIHKLGRKIVLVTRVRGVKEVVLTVDWDAFENTTDLNGVKMVLETRKPIVFTGDQTGTRIEVINLREQNWTKAK